MEERQPHEGAKAQLAVYLKTLWMMAPWRVCRVAGLVALGAMVEGIGIVLLVPLLALVFPGPNAPTGLFGWPTSPHFDGLGTIGQLIVLLGIFAVLVTIRAIVLWQRDLQLARLSADLVDGWQARIVRSLAMANWRSLQEMSHGHLQFAVTTDINRLIVGSDRLLRGGVAFLQLVVQLAVSFFLSPVLTLIAIGLLALVAPVLLPLSRASYRHGAALTRDGRKRHLVFTEFLAGLKLAKAHDVEDRYVGEFILLSGQMRERALTFLNAHLLGHNLFQMIAAFVAGTLLLVGLTVTKTSPAILTAMILLMARLGPPIQQLVQGAQSMLNMLPAVGNLVAIERQLGQGATAIEPSLIPARSPNSPAAISLIGVKYQPTARDRQVLRGINLEIAKGELVALLGPSGSGKTTLADVMIGLLEPVAGQLLVDGSPVIGEMSRAAWRRQIGYVPQDPFLFDQSLAENLRWACPDATDDELWQVLEAVEAGQFVRALPDGLEARVGDRGTRLSGGERQRISLARTLLRKPRLLVLDEATNALDQAVEQRLLETLAALRSTVTILLISHRLPEGLKFDRIFNLSEGELLDQEGPRLAKVPI